MTPKKRAVKSVEGMLRELCKSEVGNECFTLTYAADINRWEVENQTSEISGLGKSFWRSHTAKAALRKALKARGKAK